MKKRRVPRMLDWIYNAMEGGGHLALAAFGIVGGLVAWNAGDHSIAVRVGGYLLAGAVGLAFMWWIAKDARRYARRLREKPRDPPPPSKDGDMSEAAGLPPRPPWMG